MNNNPQFKRGFRGPVKPNQGEPLHGSPESHTAKKVNILPSENIGIIMQITLNVKRKIVGMASPVLVLSAVAVVAVVLGILLARLAYRNRLDVYVRPSPNSLGIVSASVEASQLATNEVFKVPPGTKFIKIRRFNTVYEALSELPTNGPVVVK